MKSRALIAGITVLTWEGIGLARGGHLSFSMLQFRPLLMAVSLPILWALCFRRYRSIHLVLGALTIAAFVRASGLEAVGAGGGTEHEDITVHAVPRGEVPGWLLRKQAEGYSVDLKVWGGLWFLDHAADGSPA